MSIAVKYRGTYSRSSVVGRSDPKFDCRGLSRVPYQSVWFSCKRLLTCRVLENVPLLARAEWRTYTLTTLRPGRRHRIGPPAENRLFGSSGGH